MKAVFLQSIMLYPVQHNPSHQCCIPALLPTPLQTGTGCSGAPHTATGQAAAVRQHL